MAASGFFEIVGELEASRDSEFDVVEGASGCGGAFTYEVEERVRQPQGGTPCRSTRRRLHR